MPDEFSPEEKQQIIANLATFSHIDQVIKKDQNFFRKYNASNYQHIPESERDDKLEFTLANILKNIDHLAFRQKIQKLDDILSKFPQDAKIKFGKKLSQPDFFSTFSEIEVYSYLLSRGKKPDLEPIISSKGNSVDMGLFLVGKYFYVEVKTPRGSSRLADYFHSLPSHESDPGLRIGVGFIDATNQLLIDSTGSNSNTDLRVYPRESSRISQLIFEEFIGRNLRNIDNTFSIPIILIINYEFVNSVFPFFYDTLELLGSLMREHPPKEFQGVLIYPPAIPLDTSPRFFPNPDYDFLTEELRFFSSLI